METNKIRQWACAVHLRAQNRASVGFQECSWRLSWYWVACSPLAGHLGYKTHSCPGSHGFTCQRTEVRGLCAIRPGGKLKKDFHILLVSQSLQKTIWQFLRRFNIHLPCWSKSFPPRYLPRKNENICLLTSIIVSIPWTLFRNVHRSFISSVQTWETSQMSIDGWEKATIWWNCAKHRNEQHMNTHKCGWVSETYAEQEGANREECL